MSGGTAEPDRRSQSSPTPDLLLIARYEETDETACSGVVDETRAATRQPASTLEARHGRRAPHAFFLHLHE